MCKPKLGKGSSKAQLGQIEKKRAGESIPPALGSKAKSKKFLVLTQSRTHNKTREQTRQANRSISKAFSSSIARNRARVFGR